MSDAIVIEYKGRIEKFEAALARLENDMRGVEKTARRSGQASGNSFDKQKASVKGLNKELKNTDKGISSMSGTVGKLGGALAAVLSVQQLISFGSHVIKITGQFQRLEAVLTNTLGSNSAAQRALATIQNFATQTPFAVAELTESYVKLANQGFKPTREELRKLGDLASSTGKGFDQLTEAVIDAQTGQFERLKEFGIRASKEGDRVSFTFKGVQQQVDFTNESIREYILGLGDAEGVSGSMAAISNTVEGKISNLGDAWDQLALAVGSSSGAIAESIGLLSEWTTAAANFITPLEEKIKREFAAEAEAYVEQQKKRLAELAKEIEAVNGDVATALDFQAEEEKKNFEQLVEYWKGKLREFEAANSKDDILGSDVLAKERRQIITNLIQVQGFLDALKDAYKETKKEFEKDIIPPKTQEDIDKEFEIEMKLLEQKEKFAIRRANLEDATEQEIIQIQKDYNDDKIDLIEKYKKQAEAIYEDHIIRREELEKEAHDTFLALKREEAEKISEFEKERDKEEKERLEERNKQSIQYAKDYADAMVEAEKQAAERRKEIQEGFFEVSQQLIDGFLEQKREKEQAQFDRELEQSEAQASQEMQLVDRQLEAGVISEAKAAAKKEAILVHQKEREAIIKRQAWIADRDAAARKARIDAFAASVKTLATLGIPAGLIPSAFALAQGLIAAGFIKSENPPKFKDGVIDLKGPGTGTSDSINAKLSRGESVMTAKETKENKPLLQSIRNNKLDSFITKNYILPLLKKKASDKANMEIRKQNTAEQIAQSLKLNQLDTSGLERQLRKNKNVNISNISELAAVLKSGYSANDL